MSRSPYQGTTRHRRDRWCGAQSSVTMDSGFEINVICTRFKDHKTTAGVREPLKHFDEVKKRSWYDEDGQSNKLPPGPCEPPAE